MNSLQADDEYQSITNADWADHAKKLQTRFMQLAPTDLPFIGARISKNAVEVFYVGTDAAAAAPSQ